MTGVDVAAFFEAAWERFEQAAQDGVQREMRCIAGVPIALEFAGTGLTEPLLPALDHHPRDGEAQFRVGLWDTASTGIEAPPPLVSRGYFNFKGEVWAHTDPRYRLAFHYGSFSLKLADLQTRRALYWVRDPARLPLWERAAPLRSILHWILPLHGRHFLHAAAVGIDGRAVLMPGAGGAGKSSTALSCLLDGMDFLGDDYVALQWEPEPRVHNLYATAKVGVSQREHFAALDGDFVREPAPDFDKLVAWLHPRWSRQLAASLPVSCVLLPEVSGGPDTALGPVDRLRVERAASQVVTGHLPGTGLDSLASCVRLSRELPHAALLLGHRRDSVAPAVRRALGSPPPPQFSEPGPCDPEAELAAAPPVSVVVPVREGPLVDEAAASLARQEYPRLEILLVNDGPTDERTADLADAHPELRLFSTWEGPRGPGVARNRGILESWSPLIAFLDADDLWPDGSLAVRLDALRADPDLDGVMGRCRVERWDDGARGFVADDRANPPERVPGAGLFRRRAFERAGLFRDEWPGEDLEWFERAEDIGLRIAQLPEITLVVRRHPGCVTRLAERHLQIRRLRVERLARRRAASS